MNWYKIYKKYPMAFKAMCQYLDETDLLVSDDILRDYLVKLGKSDWMSSIYFRELYDFFDHVDLKFEVMTDIIMSGGRAKWGCLINKRDFYKKFCKTRKEAEIKGFTKAFELLEKQLLIDSFKGEIEL